MAINRKVVCLSFILFFQIPFLSAQQNKYFIYFKDKNNSAYSISNPYLFLSPRAISRRDRFKIPITEQDLPVNKNYIDTIASRGATILYSCKWLNGVMIYATSSQLSAIETIPFVLSSSKTARLSNKVTNAVLTQSSLITQLNSEKLSQVSSINYGPSLPQFEMIGVDAMHADGFTGKGKLIAVLDDGFLNINTLPAFDSLFTYQRIKATFDFVALDSNVFTKGKGHGTEVLSLLASYQDGSLIGGVWQADYLLFKTEDDNSETISEEYNWVKAAEVADSAGADLISSSLGYNQFDDPTTSHSYADFNGDVTVAARGADIAASKGILVVTAAGNEGNTSWKYILTPADADSIIAVGGVNSDGSHSITSSIGPTADGRIKPDLVAQGTHVYILNSSGTYLYGVGTSFATPLVAGLTLGLSQAYPSLSNMEIIYFLKRSASQFAHPDNYFGYGVPNYYRFKELINNSEYNQIILSPNPVQMEKLVITIPKEELGSEGNVSVYNAEGQLMGAEYVPTLNISNPLNLDLQSWAKGVYFLTLRTNFKMYKLKFLKF
jgi:hypothetical protein